MPSPPAAGSGDPILSGDYISKGEDVAAYDAAVSTSTSYGLSVYRIGLFLGAMTAFYTAFSAGAAILLATAPIPSVMITGFSLIAPPNLNPIVAFVISTEMTYRTWQFWLKLANMSPVSGVSTAGSPAAGSGG